MIRARDPAWDQALPRVVGLVRAGLSPEQAWERSGVALPDRGTRVPLERGVLAAGQLAAEVGAPLASMLVALAAAAADRGDAQALREAALAGPRLSARILAWLPLVGIALAGLVDLGAWRMLATTPLGWSLVAIAGVLALCGRWWMRRIVTRASAGDPVLDEVRVAVPLLRAALAAGCDVPGALAAVARALVLPDLEDVARRLQAGASAHWAGSGSGSVSDPGSAWAGVDARWRDVAEAIEVAWDAGAAPDPALAAVTDALSRRTRRDDAVGAAEIGVRVSLPLTLCQLPAFIAVGVIPVLIAAVGPVALDLGPVLDSPGIEGPVLDAPP